MADVQKKAEGHVAGLAQLRAWAIDPAKGGKLFRWGEPGDFDRALAFYRDKVPAKMLRGWVANLHKLATGATPGHAPAELAAKKAS